MRLPTVCRPPSSRRYSLRTNRRRSTSRTLGRRQSTTIRWSAWPTWASAFPPRRPDRLRRPEDPALPFGFQSSRGRPSSSGSARILSSGIRGAPRACESPTNRFVPRPSLEDFQSSLKEIVFRSLLVDDDERPVRPNVLRLADHAGLPGHGRDPLSDRRTLPAVVLHEEFDPRVAVAGVQVVDLIQEIVEEFFIRDEEVHLSLQRRRLRLDLGRQLLQVHIRVHADADDHMVHIVPVYALGEDARDLPVLIHRVVRVLQAREHSEVP